MSVIGKTKIKANPMDVTPAELKKVLDMKKVVDSTYTLADCFKVLKMKKFHVDDSIRHIKGLEGSPVIVC